jgi:hypothetical protein
VERAFGARTRRVRVLHDGLSAWQVEAADSHQIAADWQAVMTNYLRFELQPKPKGKKTDVWLVVTVRGSNVIGRVCWWPQWRQYTFMPNQGTVWNQDCLRVLADFCEGATRVHRREKMAVSC